MYIFSVNLKLVYNHNLLLQSYKSKLCLQLKLLKKVATVQEDGTVQMEVPEGIQSENFHFETGIMHDGAVEDEPLDVPFTPPLQIVMLIVGTRGDVQPFVAIGKRLQVLLTFSVSFIKILTDFSFVDLSFLLFLLFFVYMYWFNNFITIAFLHAIFFRYVLG